MTLEKYDKLQFESEEIQSKITNRFQKTHTEQVFIKQEVDLENNFKASSEVRLECQKCRENFDSLKEMINHKHHESFRPQRRHYAKSRIDVTNVSSEFVADARHSGVKYDYELFQRTFFTENEKGAFMKPNKKSDESCQQRVSNAMDARISLDFKKKAMKHGINYNIEMFQKTFGFSELEATTKKAEKREANQHRIESEPAPKIRKSNEMNSSFVKALAECGIEYNLALFQKAFGCSETVDPEFREMHSRNLGKEFAEFKKKGFLDCQHCGVRFTNRNHFLRHNKSHIPRDKKLYCERCSKSFKTPACLTIHKACDHGKQIGPFECPICFKSYPDRSALRSHYYIHISERSFLCGR